MRNCENRVFRPVGSLWWRGGSGDDRDPFCKHAGGNSGHMRPKVGVLRSGAWVAPCSCVVRRLTRHRLDGSRNKPKGLGPFDQATTTSSLVRRFCGHMRQQQSKRMMWDHVSAPNWDFGGAGDFPPPLIFVSCANDELRHSGPLVATGSLSWVGCLLVWACSSLVRHLTSRSCYICSF